MCQKHLFGGPLICVAPNTDEYDGHAHRYESNTGSWQTTHDTEGDHD